MSDTSSARPKLSPEQKRALLARLLEERAARPRLFPASSAQERLWFLDQLQPDSVAYNLPVVIPWTGPLSPAALEQSLNEIVARHDSLRTTFVEKDGRPFQSIAGDLKIPLRTIELEAETEEHHAAHLARVAEREARRPFDLASGPLLRATLVRIAQEEHLLLLNMHHIVSDEWSLGVLMNELHQLYEANLRGDPSPLAPLPIQYHDYAAWQHRWLEGSEREAQLAYWLDQLEGAPTMLGLPTDRPRPAAFSFKGRSHGLKLPAPLTRRLKELARERGVSLFMVLLAGLKVLLLRYCHQSDIIVGAPIANRNRSELEGLIGFFVNTLVLRTDLSGNPTFNEVLDRVRQVTLEAYAHQDLPFEKLVEALAPERLLTSTPLIQVMLTLHSSPTLRQPHQDDHEELVADEPTQPLIQTGTSKLDLTLLLTDNGSHISGVLEYCSDLFDAETISRLASHYQTLLEEATAAPERRALKLRLMSPRERELTVVEWNRTEADRPAARCIHQLVEDRVEQSPERLALVCGDERLTYGELGSRANRLASCLVSLDVGPEQPVAICLERSPQLVIAMLAVLKAGAAYMPLDPSAGCKRHSFMLDDAKARVLICSSESFAELTELSKLTDPSGQSLTLIQVDDEKRLARFPDDNLGPRSMPQSLASIIYTSGSTGRPKAVEGEHTAITNLALWHISTFSVTADDRATQVTGPAFDASGTEIWPNLMAGASIHFPDEETRLAPEALRDWLISQQITITFLPTPLAEQAMALSWPASTSLRFMLVGGDRLRLAPRRGLGFTLINQYGPTECTVLTTSCAVPPRAHSLRAPSIGRPIDNARVYILDPDLRPVPVGVAGEVCISGQGLARGYLRRPMLTAAAFIPDPFAVAAGSRMYRTGDIARYLSSGELEFIGRRDHQVKLRGIRIELGEVEACLRAHPAVRDSVVIVHAHHQDDQILVAYVSTTSQGSDPSQVEAEDLRAYLSERLPQYMVPTAIVTLDSLPVTANGKVDRAALPAPQLARAGSYDPPGNELEERLASIWAEALEVDRVGVHDSFFDLGGHSLLAAKLISRVRAALGQEIPLRAIFDAPTVAELATVIERSRSSSPDAPQLMPVSREAHRSSRGALETPAPAAASARPSDTTTARRGPRELSERPHPPRQPRQQPAAAPGSTRTAPPIVAVPRSRHRVSRASLGQAMHRTGDRGSQQRPGDRAARGTGDSP